MRCSGEDVGPWEVFMIMTIARKCFTSYYILYIFVEIEVEEARCCQKANSTTSPLQANLCPLSLLFPHRNVSTSSDPFFELINVPCERRSFSDLLVFPAWEFQDSQDLKTVWKNDKASLLCKSQDSRMRGAMKRKLNDGNNVLVITFKYYIISPRFCWSKLRYIDAIIRP